MSRKWFVISLLLVLFIVSGYFLYQYKHKAQKTIIVSFKDVPPIIQGIIRRDITVYYRGYKVGRVSKFALSKDQKHILFYTQIDYKDLQLPRNIGIILKTEDVFGARYMSLSYPKNPSPYLLKDGDRVEGTAAYQRIDKYLMTEMETGRLKVLINNLVNLTSFANAILTDSNNGRLFNKIQKSGDKVGALLDSITEIVEDPQVKNDIKSTIKYSSKSIKDLNEIMESNRSQISQTISKAPESIDKTIRNLEALNESMPKVNNSILKTNDTVQETSSTIKVTNSLLDTTNCNLGIINRKVPDIPPCLLNKADKALTKLDCMGNELIDLLNERFILFKFLFGNPGSSFQKCKFPNPDCLCLPKENTR